MSKKLRPTKHNFRDIAETLGWEELQRGIIRFNDSIGTYSAQEIMQRFDYLVEKKIKNIRVYLTSPGGEVYSAFALYDKVRKLNDMGFKTEAIVEGYAASAASMIFLQAFAIRSAMPSARIHMHEPSRWVFLANEKKSQLEDEVDEMKAITEMIFSVLADRCKKSKEEIRRMVERRESWMSAKDAKKFGLIDSIV